MILAKLVLPIVRQKLTYQWFLTYTTFGSELVIVILLTIRLSITMQKPGASELLATDCANEVLFVPLVPKGFKEVPFYRFAACVASLAKPFIIVLLAVRLPIVLQKPSVTKRFSTGSTNKMLRMPLVPKGFKILSAYFLFASLAIKHRIELVLRKCEC